MLMACFVLADRLNKTITEIKEMSKQEFDYWFAYFELEREAIKKAQQEARRG